MKLREFFYIQKSDRSVLIFFILLLVVAFGIIFFVGGRKTPGGQPLAAADSSKTLKDSFPRGHARQYTYYDEGSGDVVVLAPFDPNTADSTQLRSLGLAPYQIKNIYRYRSKGGVYRRAEDFARLYGLTKKKYDELRPYIRISDDYRPAADFVTDSRSYGSNEGSKQWKEYKPYKEYDRDTIRFPHKIHPGQTIDLAVADTQMLKRIPGIGSGWARSIVNYGRRLGGYYSVGQLKEISDEFPVEALQYLTISKPRIKKININKLTLNQLRRHPYINFYQAKDILDYRRLRGFITDLSQLSLLKDFPPEEIRRLRPYVTY